MSSLFKFTLIFLIAVHACAQSPSFSWGGGIGNGQGTNEKIKGTYVDNAGCIYITGYVDGTIDVDPGPLQSVIASNGSRDMFLAKYSPSGNLLWSRIFGGLGQEISYQVDGKDHFLYVAGEYLQDSDLDPGPIFYTPTYYGGTSTFITRFDTSGNFLWSKGIGGPSGCSPSRLQVDTLGRIYLMGSFSGTVDFDPGPGTYFLNSTPGNGFIAKYDSSLNLSWAYNFNGVSPVRINDLRIKQNKVYICGAFSGTVDFDPGPGTSILTSAGGDDIFFGIYDSSFLPLRVNQIAGVSYQSASKMVVGDTGEVFITGIIDGITDFDPGPGTYYLNPGTYTNFIAKYQSTSSLGWAFTLFPSANGLGYDLEINSSGELYYIGIFNNICDFDPGPSINNLSNFGGDDIFIAKYSNAGTFISAQQQGGTNTEEGPVSELNSQNELIMAGNFQGIIDLDPGQGQSNFTSISPYSFYISKLSNSVSFVWGGCSVDQNGGFDQTTQVLTASNGDLFVIGEFTGTVDFDLGPGSYFMSAALTNCFIARYSSSGTFIWAKNIGGFGYDTGVDIETDNSGNIYITGRFYGSVDFDPGPGVFNLTAASNQQDIYVAKYDPLGNFIWAFKITGNNTIDVRDIEVDANSNVLITGYYVGIYDFDPGPGIYNLSPILSGWEIFAAKYSNSGSFIWAFGIGSNSQDVGTSIQTNLSGEVYLAGTFCRTIDMDPGPGISTMTNSDAFGSNTDIFYAKYSSSGNFLWSRQIGDFPSETCNKLILDGSNNIYLAGSFSGTVNFNYSMPAYNLTSNGGSDCYFLKCNPSGSLIWGKNIGGPGADAGIGLTVDPINYVYISGNFQSVADFDPGPGTQNISALGGIDGYIAKYNPNGDYIWAYNIGGINKDEVVSSVTLDPSLNVYYGGRYNGPNTDIDPSIGTSYLIHHGDWDAMLMKLDQFMIVGNPNQYSPNQLPLLYPNPANTHSTISFSSGSIQHISIIDMNGKKVIEEEFIIPLNEFTFPTSALISGIYIIQLKTSEGNYCLKLMVQ